MINELRSIISKDYSIELPISAEENSVYNYEDIKFNWTEIDPLISPLGGDFSKIRVFF